VNSKSFPPGGGWIALTVAVIAATVVSGFAFMPRFENRTVGVITGDQHGKGPLSTSGAGPDIGGGSDVGTDTTTGGVGTGPSGGHQATAAKAGDIDCAHSRNGGNTATGVSKDTITIATTDVTSGVGRDFLGEATRGMKAAINQVNRAGGICGRRINLLPPVNSGWSRTEGQHDIENFIHGDVFALVGEPDSEGLAGAIDSGAIDNAGMPVVGTDGMLADQYQSPWVWPVAASTVSNMHIVVKYAMEHGWAQNANDFAIIYDTRYKFGREGANAFDQEVKRLSTDHADIPGFSSNGGCQQQFCGISSDAGDYSSEKNQFNGVCEDSKAQKPICKVVVMLLEPGPAQRWWTDESHDHNWYVHLVGGEPLFDNGFASKCQGDCAGMVVWTGYRPVISPFDAESAVATYKNDLLAECPNCDVQNEFTQGAYLGTRLFIAACQKLADRNVPLTRETLRTTLNGETFDLKLSKPLRYGTGATHIANDSMVAYADNAAGSFNGWTYTNSDFVADPHPGADFPARGY
jgi:ABC-type branched-subunit amino acid transport system substrate-binding protein